MLHLHPISRAGRLLASVAVATTAATIVLLPDRDPQPGGQATLVVPILPLKWARDDSLPDTADTLSHEQLSDGEQAPTF